MAPQGIIIGALREIIVYTTQKEGAISVKTAHKRRGPIDLTQGPCWKVILLFSLPVIQSEILDNAASYVRPGGVLVYSTCTILPEENEQVTDAFLAQHPDFSMEPFSLPVGETDGRITLWPQRHGTDGFYICRMRRQA